MQLIDQCLCGSRSFATIQRNGLTIAVCNCGVEHLETSLTAAEYEAQYRGDYHRAVDRHPNCIPYRERYEHDKHVAQLRWHRYGYVLGEGFWPVSKSLDVGAANGAFVDFLRELGVDAHGLDPDPAMQRGTIRNGTAAELNHGETFGLVTYHDVLEHTLDPREELLHASRLLAPGGFLVVDVPDVSVEAGRHHYKAEHPWYFTLDALCDLMTDAGLVLLATDRPLAGKMVAFARAPGGRP
jgi:SAM-dependent methyltransferase